MKLRLTDLINLANVDLGQFKIHLATGSKNPPLTAYFDGRFREWQEYQTKRNFQCDSVLALIQLHSDKWLFVGAWKILGVEPRQSGQESWFQYSTSELDGLDHLTGRVVVQFARSFRASYLHAAGYADHLIVHEILPERMSMGDFPGYSSILIGFDQLRHIVAKDLSAWRAALSSVGGVYLINDRSCGKLYVGSAYGVGGIWGRWSNYALTLHGGNIELRELIAAQGAEHARHFQFAILEVCDVMEMEDRVLSREIHWKKVFDSRVFGYNSN